jgi:hypothetical protein
MVTSSGSKLCEADANAYCKSISMDEDTTQYTVNKCYKLRYARMSKAEKAQEAKHMAENKKLADHMYPPRECLDGFSVKADQSSCTPD